MELRKNLIDYQAEAIAELNEILKGIGKERYLIEFAEGDDKKLFKLLGKQDILEAQIMERAGVIDRERYYREKL